MGAVPSVGQPYAMPDPARVVRQSARICAAHGVPARTGMLFTALIAGRAAQRARESSGAAPWWLHQVQVEALRRAGTHITPETEEWDK